MPRTQLQASLHTMHDDELVDASIVACALGISARQVGRLKDLPFVDVSDRCRRYRVRDVRAWIQSRVRGTTPALEPRPRPFRAEHREPVLRATRRNT